MSKFDGTYIPRFNSGDLAFADPIKQIVSIERVQNYRDRGLEYTMRCGPEPYRVFTLLDESDTKLRALTFREFVWFRNPKTGRMMVGRTRGWMAMLIHVFTFIMALSSLTIEGPWIYAALAICVGVIVVFWLGTKANYRRYINGLRK